MSPAITQRPTAQLGGMEALARPHRRQVQTPRHQIYRRPGRPPAQGNQHRLLQLGLRPGAHVSFGRQQMEQSGARRMLSPHQHMPASPSPQQRRMERSRTAMQEMGTAIWLHIYNMWPHFQSGRRKNHRQEHSKGS